MKWYKMTDTIHMDMPDGSQRSVTLGTALPENDPIVKHMLAQPRAPIALIDTGEETPPVKAPRRTLKGSL